MNSPDPWHSMRSSPPYGRMVTPAPYFGHPFHAGPNGRGGLFVGAEAPAPDAQRADLTAAVAPVLAPATGGVQGFVALDSKQCLHAAICVDGKCYRCCVDLGPAIAAVMARFEQYHADLHGKMSGRGAARPTISGDTVGRAVDAAVGAAGQALIQMLVGQHVSTACAGWLDDIGNAIKGAAERGYPGVRKTVGELKEPIKAAAVTAATAYGGPAAGAAAAKFAGPLVDSVAEGGDTPEKKAAEEQAKTDPAAAQALQQTKETVAHTVAAYHVVNTAKKAAAGDTVAQQDIHQITQDAERGAPAAHAAAPLVHSAFSTVAEERRKPSPTYQQVASRAVTRASQQYQRRGGVPPIAFGYIRTGKHQKTYVFTRPGDAESWYTAIPSAPGAFNYAAIYEGRDLTSPSQESFGGPTTVSGAWPWYSIY